MLAGLEVPEVRKLAATLMAMGALFATPCLAQSQSFDDWLRDLRVEAAERGISQQTLDAALAGVQPIPRVIELDRRQPEFTLTFNEYIAKVAPPSRIKRGQRKYLENRALLDAIGREYRVQPRFIVALWGIETDFGKYTGGFPVIASLSTLAYDGRRSKYFRRELLDALQIIDDGHIGADKMVGSWAGAMGQSQFMPSSFRRFAVDHDGDGRRDIWGTKADVFASAANYLARSGWRDDQTWGRAVRVPAAFAPAQAGLQTRQPIGAWQAAGVRRVDGRDLPTRQLQASILLPQKGEKAPAFMVYQNFRTILKWNRSNFFGLAVGIISDGVGAVR